MQEVARNHNGLAQSPFHPQALKMPTTPARLRSGRPRARGAAAASDAPCMTQDIWIYRIVVSSFAAVLILAALGALLLAFTGKDLPQTGSTLFIALTSGAVGALAGLLAPSPKG